MGAACRALEDAFSKTPKMRGAQSAPMMEVALTVKKSAWKFRNLEAAFVEAGLVNSERAGERQWMSTDTQAVGDFCNREILNLGKQNVAGEMDDDFVLSTNVEIQISECTFRNGDWPLSAGLGISLDKILLQLK